MIDRKYLPSQLRLAVGNLQTINPAEITWAIWRIFEARNILYVHKKLKARNLQRNKSTLKFRLEIEIEAETQWK